MFLKPDKPGRLVNTIRFLIIAYGCYLFATSAYDVIGNIWLLSNGNRVQGKVASSYNETVKRSSRDRYAGSSRTIKRPIFEYEIEDTTYQIFGALSSIELQYKMGEEVEILTIPNNPSYGKVNGFVEMWLKPMLLIMLSLVLIALGKFLPRIVELISLMLKLTKGLS